MTPLPSARLVGKGIVYDTGGLNLKVRKTLCRPRSWANCSRLLASLSSRRSARANLHLLGQPLTPCSLQGQRRARDEIGHGRLRGRPRRLRVLGQALRRRARAGERPPRPEAGPTPALCRCLPAGTHGSACIVWADLDLTPAPAAQAFGAPLYAALCLAENAIGPTVRARRAPLASPTVDRVSYGAFVWACRVLNSPKRRFPARPAGVPARRYPDDAQRADGGGGAMLSPRSQTRAHCGDTSRPCVVELWRLKSLSCRRS